MQESLSQKNLLATFTLRLPVGLGEEVRERAHAARLPRADFLRTLIAEGLAAGLGPAAAPLATGELAPAARQLSGLLAGLASNLTQLTGHAQSAGVPVAQLATSGGVLERLQAACSVWLIRVRSGGDEDETESLAAALAEPAMALNSLAKKLNEGRQINPLEWQAALQGVVSLMLVGAGHG